MSNNVENIGKKQTYYFFKDIIDIKIFDLNDIKINEKSYKIFLFTTLDTQRSKI